LDKTTEVSPLILNFIINPLDIETPIVLYFSGDTMPVKDRIKTLGYHWSNMPVIEADGISETKKPQKCWNKRVPFEEMDAEAQKALKIPVQDLNLVNPQDLTTYLNLIFEKDAQKNNHKVENEEDATVQLKAPVCPEILVGKRWNKKIYGKSGSYCVYLNNQKVNITDQQKNEIEAYMAEKTRYENAVAEMNKQKELVS